MTDDYVNELRQMYGASFKGVERYSAEAVRFIVKLKTGVDFGQTLHDLEALASDLRVKVINKRRGPSIGYSASQATYEREFAAELWCVKREISGISGPAQTRYEWVEKTPAQIPVLFQDRIASIYLDQQMDHWF